MKVAKRNGKPIYEGKALVYEWPEEKGKFACGCEATHLAQWLTEKDQNMRREGAKKHLCFKCWPKDKAGRLLKIPAAR